MSKSYVEISSVSVNYGDNCALSNVNLSVPEHSIYAFIGPSGCGKSTLLRSINRLNDLVPTFRLKGQIAIDGMDVYSYTNKRDVERMRRGIGMVFQRPNPLPISIMQNMLLPVKEHYSEPTHKLEQLAVDKLKAAGLYEEVKDRLHKTATMLSGGQQQRLCIARALMLEPKLLLFDEPCSALDPISTFKIEELLKTLKQSHTIIIVTHNMEQAARVSDYTCFFYNGKIIEHGSTLDIFSKPQMELTQKYIKGVM